MLLYFARAMFRVPFFDFLVGGRIVPFKDTRKTFDGFIKQVIKCMKQCFSICQSMYILKVYSINYILR